MGQSEIAALLMRHHEAFASHDAAALAGQHSHDGTFESPAVGTVRGRSAIEQVYRYWFTALPDMSFEWLPPIVGDGRAALFWRMSGTIQGPFFGVAIPGTKVDVSGAALYVFAEDGTITSVSHIFDFSSILMKAGILKAKPA